VDQALNVPGGRSDPTHPEFTSLRRPSRAGTAANGGQKRGNALSYPTLPDLPDEGGETQVALLDSVLAKAIGEAAAARGRETACLALLFLSASCVPSMAAYAPAGENPKLALLLPAETRLAAGAATPQLAEQVLAAAEPTDLKPVSATDAAAINATIPITAGPNPGAPSLVFRASSSLDQIRAVQCLAEAVYYEARSETEDGQRAVAQVVLNRVRHPAYPGSVCGVVYQGPMRAGGGCQFTFTCDGSLALRPAGEAWLRARRIAAAALNGSVYAPVGLSTHYHTQQVLPGWAFRLAKAAVVGAHSFYRLPGGWGAPGSYGRHYAGREPSPAVVIANRLPTWVPSRFAPTSLPTAQVAALSLPVGGRTASVDATSRAEPPRNDNLPVSTVRPEFANSGRWIGDAGR
jgi:spore germination cell wall hydrolase CwlJ-like protein